jgi:ribonucleoside-diphosphate reductase alpha subunit
MSTLIKDGACETVDFRTGEIRLNGKVFPKNGTFRELVVFLANGEVSEDEINKIFPINFENIDLVYEIAKKRNASFTFETLANDIAVNAISNSFFSILAGRVISSFIKLEISGTFSENALKIRKLYDAKYIEFVEKYGKYLDAIIVEDNDWSFDIFGISTLKRAYLLRQRLLLKNERTERERKRIKRCFLETPQYMYLRVASYLWYPNLDKIKKVYNRLSNGYYSQATPTLFNAGFNKPSMSSCFLLTIDDDLESIQESWKYCASISRNAGGAGCDMSQLRHSEIARGGKSKGITPWTKIIASIFEAVDQGGKRKGSCATFLRDFHDQLIEFIEMKDPDGHENMRARSLFYGIMVSDLFMERVEKDQEWSLFCPNEVKGLCDVWGKEFEEKYLEYEKQGLWTKQIPAKRIFEKIIQSQIKTGGPYIIYIDAVNRKCNQQHSGIVRCSNLCCEIMEVTGNGEVASCNLSSICLNKCVKNGIFDFHLLGQLTEELVENGNRVIDRNYYPSSIPGIKLSNDRHRPLGIGVQGFADCLAMLDLAWVDSKRKLSREVRDLNLKMFECIYFHALKKSNKLGIRDGPYPCFQGSPVSQGILQFDMWNQEGKAERHPFIYKSESEWNDLREHVKMGMRNSLLVSLMPTASTAQILGNAESFEPFTEFIYSRTVLSGQHLVVNKHLMKDLKKYGLWTTENIRSILQNRGSIGNITGNDIDPTILNYLKHKYLTVFELPQKALIDLMIDRGRYICQSSSNNCYFSEATPLKIGAWLFYGWRHGIKTGMYYMRQKPPVDPLNHSIEAINIDSPIKIHLLTREQEPLRISSPSSSSSQNRKIKCNDEVCISCQS